MTGYSDSFNLRHKHHARLFRNRYQSIICQEDVYVRELVRYIHLIPDDHAQKIKNAPHIAKGNVMNIAKIFFALFLIVEPAYAQGVTIWAEDFEPYGYMEKGEIVGLSTDVVRFIVKDANIHVDSWTIPPWARALYQAENTPNAVLYTVVRRPEREKMFHWIGPVSDRNQYLFKLKSRQDIVLNSMEDAKKYKVGAVYGTAITDMLLSKGIQPYKVAKHDQTVKMLLAGRLDLVVHLDYSLAYIARKLGVSYSTFEPVLLVDGTHKYYVVLNKDSTLWLVEKFETSFKKLVDNGELTKIQQKYLK